MTRKEVLEYIIDKILIYADDFELACPPDRKNGCIDTASCTECWKSFIRNRYKKYKKE